jgi:hypothetical protein
LELQIPVILTAVLLAAFVPQQIAGMPRKCKGKLGAIGCAEQNVRAPIEPFLAVRIPLSVNAGCG